MYKFEMDYTDLTRTWLRSWLFCFVGSYFIIVENALFLKAVYWFVV